MIPKIVFKPMSLEENIEIIKWAFSQSDCTLDVYKYTIQLFPELASLDRDLSDSEISKFVEEIVTREYMNCLNEIKNDVIRYNNIWGSYNDKYFNKLTSYLNISWPHDKLIINASVGLIPVFPRNLDDFSFSVSPFLDDKKVIEVCAHESLHFLWFEKWKSIYPKTSREEMDSPYLPWKYSEMVTDSILNSKEIKSVINIDEKGYDSFYELYDDDVLVMDKLKKIYNCECYIDDKIKQGYEYILNLNDRKIL